MHRRRRNGWIFGIGVCVGASVAGCQGNASDDGDETTMAIAGDGSACCTTRRDPNGLCPLN